MNRLLEIGFEPAGHWVLENEKLNFELTRHSSQKNILYAFICDGQVKYVGKTVRALSVRMSGYKNPGPTQATNINNHKRIRELLFSGVAVEIFALPDNGLLHYGQFHMNLAAALEDDLIRVICPEWNGGSPEDATHLPVSVSIESTPAMPAIASFTFVLQPTYYRTGFFNVGVKSAKFLGADGETIELFLGEASHPILGTINRRANSNGTPRVMGGTGLRDWFAANASVTKNIAVDVLSQNAIRLRAEDSKIPGQVPNSV
jgi:hypothetical protein